MAVVMLGGAGLLALICLAALARGRRRARRWERAMTTLQRWDVPAAFTSARAGEPWCQVKATPNSVVVPEQRQAAPTATTSVGAAGTVCPSSRLTANAAVRASGKGKGLDTTGVLAPLMSNAAMPSGAPSRGSCQST